jgi:hypothetical protein
MAKDSATSGNMLFLILLIVSGFLQFVRLFRPEFGIWRR